MSISSRARSDWKVSGVPQRGQNVRVPCSEDPKLVGAPEVKRSSVTGTVNHATTGAPLVRRQMEQWQNVSEDGFPLASYRTNPQKQPPSNTTTP
jgi:hypothetical protein